MIDPIHSERVATPVYVDQLQRLIFELETPERDHASLLQERMSSLCRRRVPAILSAGFSGWVPADRVFVLDRLELNLGSISLDRFEEVLADRLLSALRECLQRRMWTDRVERPLLPIDVDVELTLPQRQLGFLASFLEQGTLPWSVRARGTADIEAMVVTLLEQLPTDTLALVRRLGQQDTVRWRMASQLQDPAIARLIEHLEPRNAHSVLLHAHEMRRIQRRAAFLRADGRSFRAAVWQFALTYLLVERGSQFNTRAYIKSILIQMAARYGSTYAELLRELIVAVRIAAARATADNPLGRLLLSLHDELLLGGSLSVSSPTDGGPARWPLTLSAAQLRAALLRARGVPHSFRGIVRELPAAMFQRAVELFAGAGARQLLEFQQDLAALAERGELGEMGAASGDEFPVQVREYMLSHLLTHAGQPFALSDLIASVLGTITLRRDAGFRESLVALSARTADSNLRSVYAGLEREVASSRGASREKQSGAAAHIGDALAPAVVLSPCDVAIDFLTSGIVSPAAAPLLSNSSLRWFAEALQQSPERLLPGIKAIAPRANAIRRLQHYVAPTELMLLVEALVPAHAQFILSYLLAGTRLESDATLTRAQRRHMAATHWQVVLALLLDANGPGFSRERFMAEATRRVARQLALPLPTYRARLQIMVARASGTAPAARKALSAMLASDQPNGRAPVFNTVSAPGDPLAIIRRFIRFGSLPAPLGGADALEVLIERVTQALSGRPVASRRLFRMACERDLDRWRIARVFPSPLFNALLRLLIPEQYRSASACVDALGQALGELVPGAEPELLRAALAVDLLRALHEQRGRHFELGSYLYATARGFARKHHLEAVTLLGKMLPHLDRSGIADGGLAWRSVQRLRRRLDVPAAAALAMLPEVRATSAQLDACKRQPPALAEAEGYYIGNAGLVLLWPFLPRYFATLGLVEQQAFADQSKRSRALYLLQYLASGNAKAAEPALLLNKILCGIDSVAPPEAAPVLSEAERLVSEELLHAVTRSWSKLRNTSIAGLRDSFLIRDGRLVRKSEAWWLTVDSRGYDVLLDTLPWRLSIVRLPWMQCVLHVSWR